MRLGHDRERKVLDYDDSCIVVGFSCHNKCFAPSRFAQVGTRSVSKLYSLDSSTLAKLEEVSEKFARLSNVDSPEADAEKANIQELAEKYNTYKEVKTLMGKLRVMWRSEASESRKARQLKSFTDLYKGKLELEEIIKGKLGLPTSDAVQPIQELADLEAASAKVAELEATLEKVTYNIPKGMSTRDERFFGAPQHKSPAALN